MNFRKYYYLDESFINDTYSSIFGYDNQEQEITKSNGSQFGGKIGVSKLVKAEVNANRSDGDTIKINASKTIPAKLQDILDYIDELPYYEQLSDDDFSKLLRDNLFEGVFNLSFTKLEKISNIANMIEFCGDIIGQSIYDGENGEAAIQGVKSLAERERKKGLVCTLKFVYSDKYPCYCRIDESFLKVDRSFLETEVTIICKVSRIIPKGKIINLTDLTELSKIKPPRNSTRQDRAEQVKNIKNGNNASMKEFQDEIKGPALEIVPIAIYK